MFSPQFLANSQSFQLTGPKRSKLKSNKESTLRVSLYIHFVPFLVLHFLFEFALFFMFSPLYPFYQASILVLYLLRQTKKG